MSDSPEIQDLLDQIKQASTQNQQAEPQDSVPVPQAPPAQTTNKWLWLTWGMVAGAVLLMAIDAIKGAIAQPSPPKAKVEALY